MNIESFRDYCLAKPGVTEGFPFDTKTLVFKVMGKMFALTNVDLFESINLKCDPDYAIEIRETYSAVKPGYHMSKKHWNTVIVNADVNDLQVLEWTNHSYDLVVKSLSKRLRDELQDR